jgi:ketosteroid isomerase-like protein
MKQYVLLSLLICFLIAACDHKPTVVTSDDTTFNENKQQRNKKVVMASMENFMKGDLDATFKDAAPDFVDYADGSIPPIKNLDSLKVFMRMLLSSLEGYKGENLVYFTDGAHVIVHGDWGGVFKNDMMGIKATGKSVTFKDADIFTLNEDGKITEHRSVQNLAAVLMAASAMK